MDRLKFAVIHSLDKEAQTSTASVRHAQNLLNIELPQVVSLADQLARLVGKDGNNVFYGQFGSNNREGRFPAQVELLAAGLDAETFMQLSRVAMAELEVAARLETLSTGGYVCFVLYEVNDVNFLLVAMIKEKGALSLTENLVPTETKQIDLSKLHQAARVNLARFSHFLERGEEPSDEEERTYLCFINKKQRQDIAKYFTDALGCVQGISSSRATKAAIEAVRRFAMSKPELKAVAKTLRRAVVDHMHTLPDGSVMTVATIVSVVRVAAGEQLVEHVADLGEYLNSEEVRVPESFTIDSKYVKSATRISAHADGWKLSFDDTELSESNAPIVYLRDERAVKVRLPSDTIARIEETLRLRQG